MRSGVPNKTGGQSMSTIGDRVKALSRYSPLAKALQSRGVHDWAVMVSCPSTQVEQVGKAAVKALFSPS